MDHIKNIIKITGCASIFLIFMISLFLSLIPVDIVYAEEFEETADMTIPSDYIVAGKMNKYSAKSISVNNSRYSLCREVMIFTPRNTMIPLKDIEAAEEVKLFQNKGCVRKIKVIRFAQ